MTDNERRKTPAQRSGVGSPPAVAAGSALPEAMTGRASPAKAAVGDKPVFAYIASLPQPQRSIAEAVDALAAETLPALQRSVKWGMSYYGVGDGWCFSCGGFAGHVKLMFVNGATLLDPVPPVTPTGMGKGHPRCRAHHPGRPRRAPDRHLDETDHHRPRRRRHESLTPAPPEHGPHRALPRPITAEDCAPSTPARTK